jgi:hypothetical protein
MPVRSIFCFVVTFFVCAAPAWTHPQHDLVLINGRIYTANPERPRVQAVLIQDGKITALGKTDVILKRAGAGIRVVDLAGRAVVPGLVDSHGHLMNLGFSLINLDLVGTESYQQIVDLAGTAAESRQRGEWVQGRGWDQNDWPEKEFPTHDALSARTSNNPVILTRVDGHANLVNAEAMRIAGINRDTVEPDGGKIIRDANGLPTGVFIDKAMGLVSRHVPKTTRKQQREAVSRAIQECLKYGVTSVHDAGISVETVELYKSMIDEEKFRLRVYGMIRAASPAMLPQLQSFLDQGPIIGYGDNMLTVRSIKAMTDGALGSRGAALLEDYSDEPGNRGLLITRQEPLKNLSVAALKAGFQVNTHSIGDRGNRTALRAYEAALKEVKTKNHRFRIEHAQVVHRDDFGLFKKLGVIPSMQATHATSDMYWATDRLGPSRVQGAYAWRTFLNLGIPIANGSDFPVEHVNPLWGFYASITRQDHKGWPAVGWQPNQIMSREEALRSFTIHGAYAAFEEEFKGTIEKDKVGDLVVLSKNIMKIEPKEILNTHVVMTILGGEIVYKR